jgi:hypothetical protein
LSAHTRMEEPKPPSVVDLGNERRVLLRRESMSKARLKRHDSVKDVVQESLHRALGGGIAGAMAMSVQVTTLMWMRTTVAYQYRYGSSMPEALRALHQQGGIRRFYAGFLPAMLQAPLSRFGDTASNAGVMSLLNSNESTHALPTGVKSLASASIATTWRIGLMPIDTLKTMMMVEGNGGFGKLREKMGKGGPGVLYHGATGLVGSAFIGHYFWYGTYNMLDARFPLTASSSPISQLSRNALVGFFSSVVSDTATNSIRVLKTYRQTSTTPISYGDAARTIIAQDGLLGLMGRGLATRLVSNGVQAALFSATWKYLEKRIAAMRNRH